MIQMPVQLLKRFVEAVAYACDAHGLKKRTGTEISYVAHLLGVAAIVLEYGANEEEAMGAILHDVVEECGGKSRLEDIRGRFGPAIAAIVEGCTDTTATPKPPWRERKENYVKHLPQASAATRLVSAADKLHNARATLGDYQRRGEQVWTRFPGGKAGTLWYYRALVNAFQSVEANALIEELDRVVTEIEHRAAQPVPPPASSQQLLINLD